MDSAVFIVETCGWILLCLYWRRMDGYCCVYSRDVWMDIAVFIVETCGWILLCL